MLRHRHRDPGDVGLLERVVADDRGRHLAGDRDDRDRVHLRVGEGGHEVAAAGAGRRHRDADLAGRPRIPLGRVARALLVPAQDVPDRRVEQRVVRGQDRPAGDPEDDVDAFALEGLEQRLGAVTFIGCRPSSSDGFPFQVLDRARLDPLDRGAQAPGQVPAGPLELPGVQSRRRLCSSSPANPLR